MISKMILYTKNSTAINLILVYTLMIVVFSLINPIFISAGNIRSIILNLGITGIVAVGLGFVVLTGNIDLSVSSIFVLTAVMTAKLFNIETVSIPVPLIIIIGIFMGCVMGAVNGFFVTVVGINSIITTLGTMAIFRGLAQILGELYAKRIDNELFLLMGRGYLFDFIAFPFLYLIILLGISQIVLKFTKFGRDIYSTGSNVSIAALFGVKVKKIQFSAFIISGAFSAFAGILLMSQLARATSDSGLGLEFKALTIVILGGISILGGRGSFIAVLVAIFIIGSISNGLAVMQVPIFAREALNGIILVTAILIDSIRTTKNID